MTAPQEGEGRELFTRDKDGKMVDAPLWDEILGDDMKGTWQVTDEPPKDDAKPQ